VVPVSVDHGSDAAGVGAVGLPPEKASEVLTLLAKGIRARQTYNSNNPVYQRFLGALRASFTSCFELVPELRVIVEESTFRVGDTTFTVGEGRDSLPFFFYKDGIRRLDFLPGFETEVEAFLDLVHQARQAGPEGEDLVSLFWEKEFDYFKYTYVDLLAEEVQLPGAAKLDFPPLPEGIVALELAEGGTISPGAPPELRPDAGAARPEGMLSTSDFQETLYFLDEAELEVLRAELEREWSRDLRRDVLNALFDRLEDGSPERQLKILGILRQLLPAFIIKGELAAAAQLLHELDGLLRRDGILTPEARGEAAELVAQLSAPTVLHQLIDAVANTDLGAGASALPVFFAHLGPAAFPALLQAVESTTAGVVRERLDPVLDQLGTQFSSELIALLGSGDDLVAAGAARVAGRLRLAASIGALSTLLARQSPECRLAAVGALIEIRSANAIRALQTVLSDPVREVRIAAARGLGLLRYHPAMATFEEILEGKALREADLTEKLAFFEAYALVGGPDAVPFLDRILNGRGLLGRRQPAELRACAATALGHIAGPAARSALERAREETDAVVRGAVVRALRQEHRSP